MDRYSLILLAAFPVVASAGFGATYFNSGPGVAYEWTPTYSKWTYTAPSDPAYGGPGRSMTLNVVGDGVPIGKAVGVRAAAPGAVYGSKLFTPLGKLGTRIGPIVKQYITPGNIAAAAGFLVKNGVVIAIGSALGTWLYNAGLRYFDGSGDPQFYDAPGGSHYLSPSALAAWAASSGACAANVPCPGPPSGSSWWESGVSGGLIWAHKYISNPPQSCYAGYGGYTGTPCGVSKTLAQWEALGVPINTGYSPYTEAELLNRLAQTPLPDPAGTVVDEVGLGHAPEAAPSTVDAPTTVDGGTKTEYHPDGSRTETHTTFNIDSHDNTINVTEIQTIQEFDPSGNPVGDPKVIVQPPEAPPGTNEPAPQKQLCEAYPNILACQEVGDYSPPVATIPEETFDVGAITPIPFPTGECPADMTFTVAGQSYSMSWEPVCTFASETRAIVVAIAWVWAVMFVVGGLEINRMPF